MGSTEKMNSNNGKSNRNDNGNNSYPFIPWNYKYAGHEQKKLTREGLVFLGRTLDGVPVYDRLNSHFADHGFSSETMKSALSKITQFSNFEKHVVKFDRVVGETTCVKVSENDKVIMAVRKRRQGPTPMVLGREPEPCASVVIILKKASDDEGEYFILITAFVGENSEPEPWDKQLIPGSKEHAKAVKFWKSHALLYDEEVIDYIV